MRAKFVLIPLLLLTALFSMPARAETAASPFTVEYPEAGAVQFGRAIVNLPERVIRIYSTDIEVDDFIAPTIVFPVAIGTRRHQTPLVDASIVSKRDKPTWFVPREKWAGELAGQIIPFSSGENPFRARNRQGRLEGYFLALGTHGVGLHSTREARSIGKLASHGCIRMNLDDVRYLYHNMPQGTRVTTVYQLYRIEQSSHGLVIRSFDDVYNLHTDEERLTLLQQHLARHGIPIEVLTAQEIEGLCRGEDVLLGEFDLIAPTSELACAGAGGSAGVTDAATLLGRAVAAMPR